LKLGTSQLITTCSRWCSKSSSTSFDLFCDFSVVFVSSLSGCHGGSCN
jgi:hypothetical protein